MVFEKINTPQLQSILIILAGAILPFAFAPYGIWPAALCSTLGFSIALLNSSPKQCVKKAFLFGLGLFGHGSSWVYVSIHDFGFTGVPLALVLTSVFVLFLALVFSLPFYFFGKLDHRKSYNMLLSFPALWVTGEWLRSWLFTGFPWLYLGYAHIDSPLAAFAPIGGVFLLSFLSAAFSNCALVIFTNVSKTQNKARLASSLQIVAIIFVCALAPLYLTQIEWTKPTEKAQSISIVQPNVELIRKWDPYFFPGIMSELDEAADSHWQSDIQLWPEAAIPSLYNEVLYYVDDVSNRASESQTNVISGILFDNQEPFEVYNSVIGIGAASGVYFKQKLVPFGEYVPLENWLRGLIAFFDLPNSVIKRGPYRPNAISALTKSGHQYIIAPFICYEVVYPNFVADNAQDAELLITISNDAWFGNSIGPHQHLEMVRMRALENQKYFARATNTGISAIINHKGEIQVKGAQFERLVINGEVELRQGLSPFAKLGVLPIIVLSMSILLLAFIKEQFLTRARKNAIDQ